jgi:MFS family permease
MTTSMITPAETREPSAGAYAWYVAFLLATGHLVSFIDRFLMALVMEPLKHNLGVSDTQLGLLQGTSFVILYSVVAVPLGRMADKVNRRNLIIGGIVLWSLATALCGFANSFGSLFMARVAVGFGEAALVPAAMSLLAALFPRRQLGRAVSLFTSGATLGKSAALVGGGLVLAAFTASGGLMLAGYGLMQPWQATFLVMAIPGLILAALLFTIREPARPVTSEIKPTIGTAVRYVRSNGWAYTAHVGAAATTILLIQSLAAWAPSFYGRFMGMTPSQAGLAAGGVTLFSGPLGHLCGGVLTDFFQARKARSPAAPVMALGMLASIPAAIVFATARDLPLSLTAYGVLTFSLALTAPASLAGMQMLTPDRLRGTLTSMFLATTTLIGIGIGPALIGALSDNVFGGPLGLARSILFAFPVFAVIGIALAIASRGPFAVTAANASIK